MLILRMFLGILATALVVIFGGGLWFSILSLNIVFVIFFGICLWLSLEALKTVLTG